MTPLILSPLPYNTPTMVSRARNPPSTLLETRDMGVAMGDPWHGAAPAPLSPPWVHPGGFSPPGRRAGCPSLLWEGHCGTCWCP